MDLAPPVLRRQTNAYCESCGATRERLGIGYVCYYCGTIQLTHAMSFEQFVDRVNIGEANGPFAPGIQERLDELLEIQEYELPKIGKQVGGSIELDLFATLSLMTIRELMSIARDINVKGRSKLNKSGLISTLLSKLS